jgi:hypothetical protein
MATVPVQRARPPPASEAHCHAAAARLTLVPGRGNDARAMQPGMRLVLQRGMEGRPGRAPVPANATGALSASKQAMHAGRALATTVWVPRPARASPAPALVPGKGACPAFQAAGMALAGAGALSPSLAKESMQRLGHHGMNMIQSRSYAAWTTGHLDLDLVHAWYPMMGMHWM